MGNKTLLDFAIEALLQIVAIENKENGFDWDEIEEARHIAKEALANIDRARSDNECRSSEYEFELFNEHGWGAGGSSPDPVSLLGEADHYAVMYGQDGPVEVKFYVKREVSREEIAVLGQTP